MRDQQFQETVLKFGTKYYRSMPWRTNTDPYYVLVSEVMLQQTQVERVVPKFNAFVFRFPDIVSLANAQLSEVLKLWSGLGYNRRAKFLWQTAKKIVSDFNGTMPRTMNELLTLPGVGQSTAGAILAYSFNQPVVFIETNIRTVYFNHFSKLTHDKEIALKLEHTLSDHPRQWYWALMDYGAYLKKDGVGRLAQSAHYKKQPALKGSRREMRGRIIKALITEPLSEKALRIEVVGDERFKLALKALLKEQLVKKYRGKLCLA